MTEEQIERRVESMVDALDRAYLSTSMGEVEYKRKLAEIDQWAERQYQGVR